MSGPLPPDKPRWLFTGSSGRVGRMLLRHWTHSPPPAELLVQRRRPGPGLLWDPLAGPLPATVGPLSCLIAFAGITPAGGTALAGNAALAEASLAAAHAAGIARVLLTSSSAVYGAPPHDAPLREDDPARPVNDYGRSKLDMEAVCDRWRQRGLEICCLRIGNVAGADALLLNGLASGGQPLLIDRFPDGAGPLRSYIGPATLARVTAALAAHPGPLPACLNIGAPRPVAMADLAVAGGFGHFWQVAPPAALQRITLDVGRLAGLYSFDPTDSDPQTMVGQWIRLRDPQ